MISKQDSKIDIQPGRDPSTQPNIKLGEEIQSPHMRGKNNIRQDEGTHPSRHPEIDKILPLKGEYLHAYHM